MVRVAVVALVCLAGCSDPPSDGARPDVLPQAAPDIVAPDVADLDAPSRDVRPGVRIDRILAAAGDVTALLPSFQPPRGQRAEPVANRHVAGQVDTVRTWAYDGLTLEVYDVTGGPSFVRQLTVTSGAYGTADGLSVGETRQSLEETLGPASSEAGRTATYLRDGPLPTAVRVTYQPDAAGAQRASAIEWRPPLD